MAINLIAANNILGKTIVGNFVITGILDNTTTGFESPSTRRIEDLPYYQQVITGASVNTTLKINTFSVFNRPVRGDNQSSTDIAVQCMFNDIPLQWNDVYDSRYSNSEATRGSSPFGVETQPADLAQRFLSITKANFVNKNEPLYLNQSDRLGLQVIGRVGYQPMYFSYVVSYEEVSLTA